MKKLSGWFALAAVLAVAIPSSAGAAASVTGRVVTCPAGDPLEGATVTIWLNGDYYGTATTNSTGDWSTSVTLPECDEHSNWITATLGSSLVVPYTEDRCPLGRHGTPPPCCIQLAKHVAGCDPSVAMGDLEVRCGISGAPPCPSQ